MSIAVATRAIPPLTRVTSRVIQAQLMMMPSASRSETITATTDVARVISWTENTFAMKQAIVRPHIATLAFSAFAVRMIRPPAVCRAANAMTASPVLTISASLTAAPMGHRITRCVMTGTTAREVRAWRTSTSVQSDVKAMWSAVSALNVKTMFAAQTVMVSAAALTIAATMTIRAPMMCVYLLITVFISPYRKAPNVMKKANSVTASTPVMTTVSVKRTHRLVRKWMHAKSVRPVMKRSIHVSREPRIPTRWATPARARYSA